ncbi:hypothetical protein [Streptomyces virginiae]|uniref:hypothetical protein n=1 Tax=Streptomyces virginiae TaxID=1961 RepID=UPI0022557E53|nr:hypothetical protein [Streptomyces virginiae]MCX5176705.1 hypothetical protein [Streptomyces virginiae]
MSAIELAWYGCDMRSGRIAEELRSFKGGALSRKLGASTSMSGTLVVSGAPGGWEAATDPGRTMLVAVDVATGVPIWCGLTLVRVGGSGSEVTLTAATPEIYLDRRYPGSYTATATDQTAVMAALATPALSDGPPLTLDTTSTGVLIDYTMDDSEDRTILSGWQEVSQMESGPEWIIDVVWGDAAQTKFALVARIAPTIGIVTSQPASVFDLPGCIQSYSLTESYEKGRGATSVIARGERSSDVRATSSVHEATSLLDGGWALWEERFSPASGITDTTQLDRHAAEALALMGTGSRAWALEAVASQAPRLGTDWALGDSIGVHVTASPRNPAGIQTVARAYAWSLDVDSNRVTPTLLEDE